MGEKFLNSTILSYILSKIKDLLAGKADKQNVDNIIDGTTAVGKATNDAEGNIIHETYVTEARVEEMIGQGGGGGGETFSGDATDVTYENTTSGLTATTVQEAIDELASEPSVPDGVTYINFEDGEETGELVPLNADTLGGHPVDYFATAESIENIGVTDGAVFVEYDESANPDTDNYVPINADMLDGHPANYFATKEDLENGGGASTAAQVSYDDAIVGDIPIEADNVQDAFDSIKNILNSLGGFVISKTSETLDDAKAYTNTEVADALAEAKSYTDSHTSETASNALALEGHPASYFAAASQLNNYATTAQLGNYATTNQLNDVLDEAKAFAESLFEDYINGES